jgi:hypothetical protein
MKFLILSIFSLISTAALKAQFYNHDSLKLYQHHLNPDDYKKLFPHGQENSIPGCDKSILKIPAPLLTYKGNTNGFDIYQSTPDNMYLIKPDSTIAFNMPVKQSTIQFEPVK